jgi:hypothetical protein
MDAPCASVYLSTESLLAILKLIFFDISKPPMVAVYSATGGFFFSLPYFRTSKGPLRFRTLTVYSRSLNLYPFPHAVRM